MRKFFLVSVVLTLAMFIAAGSAFSADKVLFGFERGVEGWEIPDWAYEQDDYVGEEIASSTDVAKEGKKSLNLIVAFPGGRWNGAITEIMEYFDWTPYKTISCDVYLPADAPRGLKANMVLTVGDNWKWTEMSRSFKLVAGEWTHITASLEPGSSDWKRTIVTDEFRADVRKLAIRVSSNKDAYKGSIYIDNILLSE